MIVVGRVYKNLGFWWVLFPYDFLLVLVGGCCRFAVTPVGGCESVCLTQVGELVGMTVLVL